MSAAYDMSEFEEEVEPTFAELEAQYLAAQGELELLSKKTEESEEEKALAKQLAELNRAAQALKAEREKLENERYSARQAKVHKARQADELRRLMLVAQDRERVKNAAQEFASAIDELTANAIWRTGDPDKGIYKAFQHQIDGMHFLAASRRAILADEMGLGKTGQSIMFLQAIQAKRVLMIMPGDVMMNFENEFKKWAPEIGVIRIGRKPKAEQKLLIDIMQQSTVEKIVFLVNYESWARNKSLLQWLIDFHFDTVILDEAHKIKETGKPTFKGVESIVLASNSCPECGLGVHEEVVNKYITARKCNSCNWREDMDERRNDDVALAAAMRSVKNVVCMTGTPILNRPDEIFAELRLIHPEIFTSLSRFLSMYCTVDYDNKIVWRTGGQDALAKKISGMYLRRTKKTAGIVLPPQHIVYHEIEMDKDLYPKQHKLLKMLVRNAQIEIENGKAKDILAKIALILRQRQGVCWPGGIKLRENVIGPDGMPVYEQNPKTGEYEVKTELVEVGHLYAESIIMDRAIEMAEEFIANGERVIIASQFTQALIEAEKRLGERATHIWGGMSDNEKDPIKRNFDRSYGEEPKWDALVLNYKTGGLGLNLTAATQTIFLDQEWNPAGEDQMMGRTDRIGQTEETTVHILHLEKSISKWMDDLIDQKRKMIGGFETAIGVGQMIDDVFKDMEI